MNILSYNGTSRISGMYNYSYLTNTQTQSSAASEKTAYDTYSFSEEAVKRSKTPPPETQDFENMSDEDFSSYLEQSLDAFGSLPGIENVTSVDELTDDQLSELRQTFTEMSQNAEGGVRAAGENRGNMPPDGMGPGGGKPLLSETLENADDEEIKSILAGILEEEGTLAGLEDEEITSVDELTEEQYETAKTALIEETKAHEEEMMQRQRLINTAIAKYQYNYGIA